MITYIIGGTVIVYILYAIWRIAKDVSKIIEEQHQRDIDDIEY